MTSRVSWGRADVMIARAAEVCSDSVVAPARQDLRPVAAQGGSDGRDPDRGSRRQLDELFKEHSASVARLVFRLLGADHEVDDVVQDVFVRLFRRLDTIRDPGAVRAWLVTTAVRMVRRRLRLRRIGFLLRGGQRVDPMELEAHGPSAEDRLALWTIHRALGGVSADARIAWILRHLEQDGIDDIARVLGCSKATAKRRVAEAQLAVKKALTR
jgi:RNA polymerase sigma-70 factor (ECF subfamily)